MHGKKICFFRCLYLESVSAVAAHALSHRKTAQDADGKEEDGEEDGAAAVVVDQDARAAIRTIAHATHGHHRWRLDHNRWLVCQVAIK